MNRFVLAVVGVLAAGAAEATVAPVVNESTGDLSLTYSFKLPKARGRVQPSLDLVYSSGSGEDRGYGVGWSLSAHYIERETRGSPGTSYLWLSAGTARRLLVQTGATYRAEVEEEYFEITPGAGGTYSAKDGAGNTYEYTRAFGTRMYLTRIADLDGNEIRFNYAVGQEDLTSIEYNKTPSGSFATKVDLTFASALDRPPRAAVAGVLADRALRLTKVSISGLPEIGAHRITGGYTLAYIGVGAGAVVLERITEFGGDSVASRPPTVFEYDSNAFGLSAATQTIALQRGSVPTWIQKARWADVDGDGLTDVVITEGLSSTNPQLHWAKSRATPEGGVQLDVPVSIQLPSGSTAGELLDFDGDGVMDFIQSRLVGGQIKHTIHRGAVANGAFVIGILPQIELDVTDVSRKVWNSGTQQWYAPLHGKRTAMMDLNGDGVLDYARIPTDTACGSDMDAPSTPCQWEYGLTQIYGAGAPTVRKSLQVLDGVPGGEWWTGADPEHNWLGMDVNGDGLADAVRNSRFATAQTSWNVVYFWTSNQWRVALNTGITAAGTLDFSLARAQTWGDASDLAGYADSPNVAVTSLSDTEECGQRTIEDTRYTISDLMDLNGDGRPDFVRRRAAFQQQISWNTGNHETGFNVVAEPRYIANAREWPRFNPDGTDVEWNATVNCGPPQEYMPCFCSFGASGLWGEYVDVSGDGVLDFVLSDNSGIPTNLTVWRGVSSSGVARAVMLRHVTLADGAVYDVDYVPSTWFGGRQSRRAVVSRVGIRGAFVAPNSTYYWYAGPVETRAWYDLTKPDDRGFLESWSQDATTRVVRHTRWYTDSRPLLGRQVWTETGVAAAMGTPATATSRGSAPTAFAVFAKRSFQYGWKRWDDRGLNRSCSGGEPFTTDYPVRVVATLTTDESRYDGSASSAQVQTQVSCSDVDEYGRIHKVTTTPSIGGVAGASLVTESRFNGTNAGCVNAPQEFRLLQKTSGGGTLSEEVTLYDSACRATLTYSPTTTGDTKRISYSYGGPFGQLTETTTGGVTTRVIYESTQGLHVLQEQTDDGATLLATVYSVDYATGLRTSVQGPIVLKKNGVTAPNVPSTKRYHIYDAFGRPVAVSKEAPTINEGDVSAAHFVPRATSIVGAVELNRYDDVSTPRSVRSYRYSVLPGPFDPATVTPAADDASETIAYRDGLGRVIQVRERMGGGGAADAAAQVVQSLSGYKVAKAVLYDGAGREWISLEPFYAPTGAFVDFSTALPSTRATVITYDDQASGLTGLRRGSAWCKSYQYVSGALPPAAQTCTSNSSGSSSFRLATETRYATRTEAQRYEYAGRLIAVDVITPEVNESGGTQAQTTYLDPAGRELGSRDADGRYTWIQLDELGRERRSWRASATHATPIPATSIDYNAAGQVENVWDANSPTVRRTSRYDVAGRLDLIEYVDAATGLPTGDRLDHVYEIGDIGQLTEIREYRSGGPPQGTLVARNQYDIPYGGDPSFEYVAGKLAATWNGHSTVVYGYDDAGRVKRRDQYFAALPGRFTVDSVYGADGRVLSSQVVNPYDAANSFRYEVNYDSAGRPVQLSGKLASTANATVFYTAVAGSTYGAYDAVGRVLTMRADDDRVVSARRYNAYSGALNGECKRFAGAEVECMSTGIDLALDIYRSDQVAFTYQGSKLKSYTDSLTGTRYENSYSVSGRLTSSMAVPEGTATSLTQDWSEGFQFNGIGNIDHVTRLRNFTLQGERTWSLEQADYVPAVDAGGMLDRVESVARQVYYSMPTTETGGTTAYEYDVLGHLTKVTRSAGESEELFYAPGGELLYRKLEGRYVFYVGEYATVTAEATWTGEPDETKAEVDAHVVFAGTRIASVNSSRALYYYRSRLGSVVATSLGGTNERAEYRYTPYGELELTRYSTTDPQVQKKLLSELGYTNALRLTGQLIYLQTRVYDAEARLFIQPDSVDRFRYAYVAGDPVNYSDPTGLMARPEVQQDVSISPLALMASWDLMSLAAVDHSKRILQDPPTSKTQTARERNEQQPPAALQNDQGKVDALSPEAPPAPPNGEPGLQPGDRSRSMRAGEALYGEDVRKLIGQYGKEIDTAASDFRVDAGLIRAIIYEEQTHLVPGLESNVLERVGIGRTVGLGQVTEGLHGFTREQLLDPATNIRAIATHLSVLQKQPLISPSAPISSLATSYNCGSCTSITAYGRRVNFYRSQFFLP